jgi:hypothetical protein
LVAGYGLLQWLTTPLLGLDYLAQAMTPVLWLLLFSRALAGATAATYSV